MSIYGKRPGPQACKDPMYIKKRALKILLAYAGVAFSCVTCAISAPERELVVLFTHDMHGHLDSFSVPGSGERGGFPRVARIVSSEREAAPGGTLLLDAGDFSMGTLFDTILAEESPELTGMSLLGYDAITFGNHDFEAGAGVTAAELGNLIGRPRRPEIVTTNLLLDESAPGVPELRHVLDTWPVRKYAVFERRGLKVCVFGVMGRQAAEYKYAPGISYSDGVSAASDTVRELRGEAGCDMVIALSHSGTSSRSEVSEDQLLAAAVPGIDLIVSGHSHTVLEKPIREGGALIVSAGSWGRWLGKIRLRERPGGGFSEAGYQLIEVGQGPEDMGVRVFVNRMKERVEESYLYGFGFDEGIAFSSVSFPSPVSVGYSTAPLAMGDLAADAFRAAVRAAEGPGSLHVSAAFVPLGTIKTSIPSGRIRVSDVFSVFAANNGPDGRAGMPLATFFLRGKDIRRYLESEATIARANPAARLMVSGIRFSWDPSTPPFSRVRAVHIESPEGGYVPLKKDGLYRVVMSVLSASYMKKSFNPEILPLDCDGLPLGEISRAIVRTSDGEVKEWAALADFLRGFPRTGAENIPEIPERYGTPRDFEQVLP